MKPAAAEKPRILIVTASFGDGHNSAANSLAEALSEQGAQVRVRDYLAETSPDTNRKLVRFYRWAITHFPRGWGQLYTLAKHARFNRSLINYFARSCRRIRRSVNHWQPHVVISTYPLYPFLFERLSRKQRIPAIPIHTIVTDSITINRVWFRAHSTSYFVTDNHSRQVLIDAKVPPQHIHAHGFPVSKVFRTLPERPALPQGDQPARILYLPTAKRQLCANTLQSLTKVKHPLQLTIVMGRHEARLRPIIEEIQSQNYPHPIQLIGWTDQVPQLMHSHHIGIAKAGGATVHEARAARLPIICNYVVPGQEEGNAELIELENSGYVVSNPTEISHHINLLLTRNANALRQLQDELSQNSTPHAAATISTQILQTLRKH